MNRIYKCFPGGKFKVLTLSYDDGKLEDKRLVDIFNKNGIRATFNVNSGLTDMPIRLPASEWNDLYDNHEIALHTCTHPTMNRCGSYEIAREILEDKTNIEKIIHKPVEEWLFLMEPATSLLLLLLLTLALNIYDQPLTSTLLSNQHSNMPTIVKVLFFLVMKMAFLCQQII